MTLRALGRVPFSRAGSTRGDELPPALGGSPSRRDSAPPPPSSHTYRLRGKVDEAERRFELVPGVNRIGRAADLNEVVVPVAGVSREHARLEVGPEGVELEDLSSRNGTFVDGVRVRRMRLANGSAIVLGPVTLVLEEVDPADAELGLAIEETLAQAPGARSSDRTTAELAVSSSSGVGFELALIEEILRDLTSSASPELSRGLGALIRVVGASGACLLEWTRPRDPVALAAVGHVDDPWTDKGLLALRESVAREGLSRVACQTGTSTDPVPLSYVVLARPGTTPLGLVVTWRKAPDHKRAKPLLRVLLSLADLLRAADAPASGGTHGRELPDLVFPDDYVVGTSPEMSALYEAMRPLARSTLAVLIEGETGVGKEHIARILHASSDRAAGPFVAVNCAAIPAELLEAEMFGVGEGVATGVRARSGQFQLADRGTLLLDEVGDLPLPMQAKLLRALQSKEIQPLGLGAVRVDVRVLACTNANLRRSVEEGRFRSDLYYRIAGAVLRVPPLRERKDDIPLVAAHFLRRFAQQAGKTIRGVTVKALRALEGYSWPGNVRELEHELGRLAQICPEGQAVDSTMLRPLVNVVASAPSTPDLQGSLRLEGHVDAVERQVITEALRRAGGSQRKAAQLLDISRNALSRKLERLGIAVEAD
jgi:DNA-binding NtrC family response regulator